MSTLTALQTQGGFKYVLVAIIEGHDTLLTSGRTAETITAYAGTAWSAATAGLSWDGSMTQNLTPWKPEIQTATARLLIAGPGAETVARQVLRMASDNPMTETRLTAPVDNSTVSIEVVNSAAMGVATDLYIGGERCLIDSLDTATDILLAERGRYHPFTAEMDPAGDFHFGRHHRFTSVGAGVALAPKVTQQCTQWRGKWVEVRMHERTASGTIATYANSHRVFAGRIVDLYDTEDGRTAIEIEDVRAEIRNKVLLSDQFVGKAKEGVYLTVGSRFTAKDEKTGADPRAPSDLIVVSGSPANAYEVQEGFVTVDDLLAAMNAWLTEALVVDTDLYATSYFSLIPTEQGTRVAYNSNFSGVATSVQCRSRIGLPWNVGRFLGVEPTNNLDYIVENGWGAGGTDLQAVASNPPRRVMLGQAHQTVGSTSFIDTEQVTGTFIDQSATLPDTLLNSVTTAGTWGVIDVEGKRLIAKYNGNGSFSHVSAPEYLEPPGFRLQDIGLLYDEDGDIRVKQCIYLEEMPTALICALLASTGTESYNHTTHDRLDWQLGAGIPWELLGDPFEQSLQAIEDASNAGPSFLLIDKPTKLTEILGAEFLLRLSQIIWKAGGLRVTAWQTASAVLSSHAFTGSTKASPIKQDPQRSPSRLTGDHMQNIVKVEFNRAPDGTYADTISLTDADSVTSNGGAPITISAANSVGGRVAVGQNVEALVGDMLVKWPLLSRPMWMHRRTVSRKFWEDVAPGDICTVTDAYARNPSTGRRGLTGHPGIIFTVKREFASGFAEVIIALNPEDRTGTYCPAAEIDRTFTSGAFTTGYDAAGKKVKLQANRHSRPDDPIDTDRGHFAVGDQVVFIEIDPANPAAPTTVNDVIAAVGTNEVTLTTGSASLSGTTPMRMISRYYTTATSTQKVDTYQADDADEQIQDAAAPYQYAVTLYPPDFDPTAIRANPVTQLASRHATMYYGDGAPLDVGAEDDLIRAHNNHIHVVSACIRPWIYDEVCTSGTGAGWFLLDEVPLHLGPQKLVGLHRYLTIAPFFRVDTAGANSLRVRLSWTGAFGTSNTNANTLSPYTEVTFSTSTTTWGTATPQDISISPIPNDGNVYLIVEAEEDIEYRGMAICQLGVGLTT